MRVAAGAVQQQDGVVDMAGGVAVRRAQREVVQLELGQSFAGAEAEVGDGVDAVFGGPVRGCGGLRGERGGECGTGERRCDFAEHRDASGYFVAGGVVSGLVMSSR